MAKKTTKSETSTTKDKPTRKLVATCDNVREIVKDRKHKYVMECFDNNGVVFDAWANKPKSNNAIVLPQRGQTVIVAEWEKDGEFYYSFNVQ